jgi:hypothetical protein
MGAPSGYSYYPQCREEAWVLVDITGFRPPLGGGKEDCS